MIRVYIAGPYSNGEVEGEDVREANCKKAMVVAAELLMEGFTPFCPHLTHYLDLAHPGISYDRWMEYDKQWLKQCHALLRLPGESCGADLEVLWAFQENIRVFTDVEDLRSWAKSTINFEGEDYYAAD